MSKVDPVAGPRAAFYGDDVTGSVDALLQFARLGWSGRLFVGAPSVAALSVAAAEADVVGIAGIARSLPTEALEAEVRPALEALAALDPAVLQYKACSTVDSSPEIGSLGRVIEIGRAVTGDRPVPLVFAQPDFGRYTAFGHHFAAEGGVVYRLDRQPTMSQHPSTPMDESDIAVHLRRQTDLPISRIPLTSYGTAAELGTRLAKSPDAAVVLDVLDDDHLRLIGAALAQLPRGVFAVGSGGLSRAIAAGAASRDVSLARATPARGPVLAVSGSRSAQTRRQMDASAGAGWHVEPLVVGGGAAAIATRAVEALRAGQSVALSSDDAMVGGEDVLEALTSAAAAVARAAVEAGVTSRVIVCGGDSSSRIVRLLGVESLSIAAHPWGNVVLLRAHSADPVVDGIEVLLKGGQVGADDLFESIRVLDI